MTKAGKFLVILKLELEDSMTDLCGMLESCREKAESQKVTEYVSRENEAIIRQEISGLHACIESIKSLDPANFHGLADAEDGLFKIFKGIIEKHGFPQALLVRIKEIIAKVREFVESP